jgi:aryl-alcohol dehydrogenase-like predicted oxidoreductase
VSAAVERVELAPGYPVCRVANGLWQLSRGHGSAPIEPRDAVRFLHRLVDAGLTTFDCADIYLGVEELLGRLVRELRDAGRDPATIQVHTKYVPDRSALAGLTKHDVAAAVEGSLRRLGVERLDLVQFHWWDWQQPGYVDVAGWLSDLVDAGAIRCLGTTNFDRVHLGELISAGIPVATNQVQYSLLDRRVERGMAELALENGIGLLCYGVLAGGFLSERWFGAAEPVTPLENRSLVKYRLIIDDFGGWGSFQELLRTLAAIARRHGATVSAVAARWVLDRDGAATVILGARSAAHLEDNLDIFTIRLDEDDRHRIDGILRQAAGPAGEPFELERQPGGRHASLMWTDLNRNRGA